MKQVQDRNTRARKRAKFAQPASKPKPRPTTWLFVAGGVVAVLLVAWMLRANIVPSTAEAGSLQAGDTRYFQFWFRDPLGGPAGFNFSDGLEVGFCQ